MSIYSRWMSPLIVFGIATGFVSKIEQDRWVTLPKIKIKADRHSPAFAAIEDAFVLKDYIKKEPIKIKVQDHQKLELKGMKISLHQDQDLKSVQIAHAVKMQGEVVEVTHFTNKFIKNSTRQPALQKEELKLAAINPHWGKSQSQLNEIKLSNPIEIKNIPTKNLSAPIANEKTVLAQEAEVLRVVLPSGVVVKNLSPQAPKTKVIKTPSSQIVVASLINKKPVILKGKIKIDGAAFDGGENYTYYLERILNNKIYESGAVIADTEDFEIELGDEQGYLAIELRDDKGEVVAYGESDVAKIQENKEVMLFATEDLFAGQVLDTNSNTPVAKADLKIESVHGQVVSDEEGYFNEPIFDKGSSFVAGADKKDHWSEVQIAISGKPFYPKLTKRGALESLSKNADEFGEEIEISSLIMGLVSQSGLGQSDLKVQVYGMEFYKPVYFNNLDQPDPSLQKTSRNSKFAFLNLPEGGYLIQVLRGETLISQKWFVVREGHIASGQIDLNQKHQVAASFTNFPENKDGLKQLNIKEVGSPSDFILIEQDHNNLDLMSQPELAIFETPESEEIKKHIYITLTKSIKKEFNIVNTRWLEQHLNARRSNANRSMGFVVGLNQSRDFEVVLETTSAKSKTSQVFYFDKNGNRTDEGVIGGGFIITDVPSGFKSVTLKQRGSQNFLNKLVLAEGRAISIF